MSFVKRTCHLKVLNQTIIAARSSYLTKCYKYDYVSGFRKNGLNGNKLRSSFAYRISEHAPLRSIASKN